MSCGAGVCGGVGAGVAVRVQFAGGGVLRRGTGAGGPSGAGPGGAVIAAGNGPCAGTGPPVRRARARLGALLAPLLALVFTALGAGAAHGLDAVKLMGTTDSGSSDYITLGLEGNRNTDGADNPGDGSRGGRTGLAHAFTTGDAKHGYRLTEVLVDVHDIKDPADLVLLAAIREAVSPGNDETIPIHSFGATNLRLDESLVANATNRFTVFLDPWLLPETTYWIVFECLRGSCGESGEPYIQLGRIRPSVDGLDADSLSGWSLPNTVQMQMVSGETIKFSDDDFHVAFRMALNGFVYDGPRVVDGGVAITSTPRGLPASRGPGYAIGDTLEISVTFDEKVAVASGSDPGFRFWMADGFTMAGEEWTAAYAGGSGTKVLRFEYTFTGDEPSVDPAVGIEIPEDQFTWTGADGNITNTAGTKNAFLRHAAPGPQAGHGFEPVARPAVHSMRFVSSPRGPGGYGVGETIEVEVVVAWETVLVRGDVQAALQVGPRTRTMHFLRGDLTGDFSGDAVEMRSFVLGYVVQAGDLDADGVTIPANAFATDGDPLLGPRGQFEIYAPNEGLLDLATDAVDAGAGHKVDGSYSADADPRLDGLAVAGRTLVPAFDRDVFAYTVGVGDSGTVTVTAAPTIGRASFTIAPPDARLDTAGHQVALAPGANTVEVTGTSRDGTHTRNYTVIVVRTGRALVSNHGRTVRGSAGGRSAQPFTTGSNAGGYVLEAVQVSLDANNTPASGDALVRIFTDDDGPPGESIATLTAPATITANAVNTFTAPAGTWLAPGTTYHVVTTNAAGTGGFHVNLTESHAEDAGKAPGWSIGDDRYGKASGATADWVLQGVSAMIGIVGTVGVRPQSDNARLAALSLTGAGGDAVAIAPAPFDTATPAYTAVVGHGIDRVTLRAAAVDPNATVAITHDNDPATPGEAVLALVEGANPLTVTVTSEDGSRTGTWTVTVERQAPAAPCPVPNDWCATMTTGYAAHHIDALRTEELGHGAGLGALTPADFTFNAVGYRVTELRRTIETFDPTGAVLRDFLTLDAGAELPAGTVVTVGGAELTVGPDAATATVGRYRWDFTAPGAPAPPARWAVGSAVAVSARIAVASGDATLSALSLAGFDGAAIDLDPAPFDPATVAYATSVHHFVNRVTLRVVKSAPTAQVAIAGDDDPATPAEASLRLATGANTLTVTVADRGVTRTYTVTVTRARKPSPLPLSSMATLWSATLAVSDIDQHFPEPQGCANRSQVSPYQCRVALSDDEFTLYDTTFRVEDFVLFGGDAAGLLRIDLDTSITANVPAPALNAMVLDVGGTLLSLGDGLQVGSNVQWSDTGLDWTAGDHVDLRLLGRSPNARIDAPTVTDDLGEVHPTVPAAGRPDAFAAMLAGPTQRVELEVVAQSPFATVAIAGDTDPATPGEATLDVGRGLNELEVTVNAQDGFTSRTHTVLARWLEVLGAAVVSSPDSGPGDDAPGTYGAGERIVVEVEWSENGAVTHPRLALRIGDRRRVARCEDPADAPYCPVTDGKLRLAYDVTRTDADALGIRIPAGALAFDWFADVHGQSICASSRTECAVRLRADPQPAAVGPLAAHRVEGRPLAVSVAAPAAVAEGAAAAFPVTLPYASADPVTVTWSTADDTATAGADYTAVAGATLTIAPGETAATATVQTLDDALDEDEERFTVVLDAVAGAEGIDPNATAATAAVTDDDPVPSLAVADARVLEGETAGLAVTLSAPSGRALEAAWSSADVTAAAGADYTATSGTVTFAPGETRAVLGVQTLVDADDAEGDETFAVSVTRAAYPGESGPGETAAATATIVDAGSVPGAPAGLAATPAGSRRIDLSWTAPATGPAFSGYRVEGSGDGGATWSVLAADTGSTAVEWTETGLAPAETRRYRVRALGAHGAGPASAVADATTHHGVLGIRIRSTPASGRTYREGEEIVVDVELSMAGYTGTGYPRLELEMGGATRLLTLDHCLDTGDGVIGEYCSTSAQGVLRFRYPVAAGDADADGLRIPADTLEIGTFTTYGGDTLCEPGDQGGSCDGHADPSHEAFGPFASHKVDARVQAASVADAAPVAEGDGTASFPVRLLFAPAAPVTVTWSTFGDEGAAAGEDYVAVAGATLTFAPGETEKHAVVTILDDALDEDAEGFTVELDAAAGAVVAPDGQSGVAVIADDDATPALAVTAYGAVEGRDAAFEVTLSAPSGRSLEVAWSTADGTATAGEDYVATAGAALTFEPGETEATLAVETLADADDTEGEEAFTVTVTRAPYPGETGDAGDTVTATGTLVDPSVVPGAVTDLRARVEGPRRVDLSWNAPSTGAAVTGYRIERWDASSSTWHVLVADTGGVATAWSDTGVEPAQTHAWRVTALGTEGAGPPAHPASATTPHGVRGIEIVSTPAAGDTYREGERIEVAVELSAVGEVRNPRLRLDVGGTQRTARCRTPDAGTTNRCTTTASAPTLRLAWTVTGADVDADGVSIPADALALDPIGIVTPASRYICAPSATSNLCGLEYDLSHAALGPFPAHRVLGPEVLASVADAAATAEGGAAAFALSLGYPVTAPVTVTWSTADDTATAGADYTAVAGATFTFAPGETAGTVTVETLDDALDEDPETFTVVLDAAAGADGLAAASSAAAVIEDDDPVPSLAVADARVVEGETAGFEVTLSAPSGRGLEAAWSTADDTATAGTDYTSASSTVMFAPGETRATFAVETLADADGTEGDETFTVTLIRAPYAGEVGAGQTVSATGTIVDTGSVPGAPAGLAATPAGARRIDLAWTAPATGAAVTGYRVEGSGDGGATWSVLAADTGSTAVEWSETGLAPRETRRYRVRALGAHGAGPVSAEADAITHHGVLGISVTSTPAFGDTYAEGEVILVEVALSMAGEIVQLLGADSSPRLGLEVGGATRVLSVEHCLDTGLTTLGITNCLTTAQGVLRLAYTVAAWDADADGVRVPADALDLGVYVSTFFGDLACNPGFQDSSCTARSDPSHPAFGPFASHKVEAQDPWVSVAGAAPAAEGSTLRFPVRLTHAAGGEVTVGWSTADGTAVAGADYAAASGTVTFAAGETEKHVEVATLDDALDEDPETLTVTLGAHTGAEGVDPGAASAAGAITDDDAPPALSVAPARGPEGDEVTFFATLAAPSGRAFEVTWLTANGTARAGRDYVAVSGATLTFAPGETAATLRVETLADTKAGEGAETFTVTVTRAPYAGEAGDAGETVVATGTVVEPDTVPGAPGGLVATATSPSRIDLAWTAPATGPALDGYRIETSPDGVAAWSVRVADTNATSTAWSDTGLAPGTTRHYRVRGLGAGGPGPASAVAGATTARHTVRGVAIVSAPASGDTYLEGERIEAEVHLSVLGSVAEPRLRLDVGGNLREALCHIPGTVCVATPAQPKLRLVYTVTELDTDADGVAIPADAFSTAAAGVRTDAGEVVCPLGSAGGSCTGFIDLSHPGVAADPGQRVEGRPLSVGVHDAGAVTEGGTATFPVRLNRAAAATVTATWATRDGTATAGEDYTAASGTVTFAPGETAGAATVGTHGNALDEAAERFVVWLTASTGAAGIDPNASSSAAVIEDDDPVPALTVTGHDTSEGEPALVGVSLAAPSGRALEVAWSTADGTATAGADYTAASGTVTFAPGETTAGALTVVTLADTDTEDDETFEVTVVRAGYPGEDADPGETRTVTVTVGDVAAVPDAPGSLRATGSARQVVLVWAAPAAGVAVTGYRVEASDDAGTSWEVAAAGLGATSRRWTDTGLGPRQTRRYRVRALGASGPGPASGTADGTTYHGVRGIEVVSTPAAGGAYRQGEAIVVEVDLTALGAVHLPRLQLLVGGVTREATCRVRDPGNSSNVCTTTASKPKLELAWTVTGSDVDADGIEFAADSLALHPLGIGAADGTYVCKPGVSDPQCASSFELSHPAFGPDPAHRVEGRWWRVSVAAGAPATAEGGTAAFALALSNPETAPVTVTWSTADDTANDTATAGADYTAVAGATFTFAPGVTAGTVTVETLDDALDEGAESFTVVLDSVTGGDGPDPNAASATAVIEDDDPVPSLAVADARVLEGETAVLAVTLSAPSGRGLEAAWSTADDTATAGADYTTASSSVMFAPGETRAVLEVATLADTDGTEGEETFTVTLIRDPYPGEADAGETVSATGTVVDPALVPVAPTGLAATPAGARQVDLAWTAPATGAAVTGYRVEGSGDGGATWTVLAADTGSTATAWTDTGLAPRETRRYRVRALGTHGAGPVSGVADATTHHGVLGISIGSAPAFGDTYAVGEGIVVEVALSMAGEFGTLGYPRLALEVGGATRRLTSEHCLDELDSIFCTTSAEGVLRLAYTVAAWDADADGVRIPADALEILGVFVSDPDNPGTFPFICALESPAPPCDAGYSDASHDAYGPFPSHKVDAVPLAASVADAAAVVEGSALSFPVRLTRAAGVEVTVDWSAADGTAAAGADYVAASGTLTFTPGETERHAEVATVDDALDEDPEALTVTLGAFTGLAGLVPGATSAAGTITDDDDPPAFSVAGGRGPEGDDAEFEVTLASPSGRALAVTWSTVDGTATAGTDYVVVTDASFTFAAGETVGTLAVETLVDGVLEPNEALGVTVTRAPYDDEAGAGQAASATATLVDLEAVPSAPSGLAATPAGARAVDLAWTAPATGVVTGYRVEASADGGVVWTAAGADIGTSPTAWTHAGLAPNTALRYRVRGLGPRGAGPPSAPADATTHAGVAGIAIVSSPASGDTYALGEAIVVEVELDLPDEAVAQATAATYLSPGLGLGIGGDTRATGCTRPEPGSASRCASETGLTKLRLAWTVDLTDIDPDGVAVAADALALDPVALELGGDHGCRPGETDPRCDFFLDLSHPAWGPFPGHKVEGRLLLVAVAPPAAATAEGGTATFGLSLPYPSAAPVTVTWLTADGTAAAGADYVAASGTTFTFAPGETAGTVTVATLDDALDEDEETFRVVLDAVTGADGLEPGASFAAAAVADDDPVPVLALAAARAVEGEAAGFAVTLSAPSGRALEADWETADATATAGEDYTAATGSTVTIAPGETRAVLAVETLADADATEGNETFTVTLVRDPYADETGPGQTLTATGTVVEPAAVPEAPGDFTATPGGSRHVDLAWTAATSGPAVAGYRIEGSGDGGATWSVLVADTGSTATEWTETGLARGETRHYRVRALGANGAGPASAVASATTAEVEVADIRIVSTPASGDTYGFGEEIVVEVEFAVPATYTMRGANDRISNPEIGLRIGGAIRELRQCPPELVHSALAPNLVCAFRDGTSSPFLRLVHTVTADDADADGIEVPSNALSLMDAGILAMAIHGVGNVCPLAVRDDPLFPCQAFYDPSHPAYGPFPGHKVEGRPFAASVAAAEAVVEGSAARFPVRLPYPGGHEVTVAWSTVEDTAAAGADYTATSSTLTFAPGETEKHAEVATVDDALDEDPETFTVRLDSARGAGLDLGALSAAVTVTDNHPEPALAIRDGAAAEGDGALGLEVVLAPASGREVTVAWATADGTATAGADYAAATSTLVFAPGETAKTVEVTLLDDAVDEEAETLTVTLDAPVDATLGTAAATGTVTDDDDPPVLALAVAPLEIPEAGGRATVTVAITNGVVFPADRTVELAFAGSAGAGEFTVEAGGAALSPPYRLTLPAGATSTAATVTPVDDAVYEGDETIAVSASQGGAAVGPAATIVVTDEGDRAQVTNMAHLSDPGATSVGRWPFKLLVAFDRDVEGLEAGEVEVSGARVVSVQRRTSGGQPVLHDAFVLSVRPLGAAGETLRVHVPENVVDGGNAASAADVEFAAVITGTDAATTLATTAAEPVSGPFDVSIAFTASVCWSGGPAPFSAECPGRAQAHHLVVGDVVTGGSATTSLLAWTDFLDNTSMAFSATITPGDDLEGTLAVTLPAGAAATRDGGRTLDGRLEVEVDTLGPQLLAATASGTELTLAFHETLAASPGRGRFAVTVDGAAATVSSVSRSGSTVVLTLAAAVPETGAVRVSYELATNAANRIQDAAGNEAAAFDDETVDIDAGAAPALTGAEVRGAALTLTWDEPLDESSVPDAADFPVRVDGAAAAVSAVAVSGVAVHLALATAVQAGQAVTAGYEPGTGAPLQDAGGTPAVGQAAIAATNLTPARAPVLASARVDGARLEMRWDEALDEGSEPAPGDFAVTAERAAVAVSAVDVSGPSVVLTLARAVAWGDVTTLAWTPGTHPIRDLGGTAAAALADVEVANDTPHPGPALESAHASAATLVLTFDRALDEGSEPAPGDFAVTADGFATTVLSVRVSGSTVVLGLAAPPGSGAAVLVGYTPGTDPIRDAGGTRAEGFSGVPVAVDAVPVAVSFLDAAITVVEGTDLGVSVTLDRDPERTVSVPLTAAPGAGTSAADFAGVPAALTFESGDTVRVFTFTAVDDAADDDGKSVALGFGTLPAWVSAGARATSAVTIEDDDVPTLRVTGAGGTEGEAIELEVTLVPASREAVTVDWSTADGGAAAGTDYVAASGTLTFAGGEGVARLTVQTLEDTLDEDDEGFEVRIGPASGAPLDPDAATAVATIADDDPEPALAIGDASVGESGGAAHFEVTLTPASGREVTVDWATADGTATAGEDYAAAASTLTFAAGATAATVTVQVLDDTLDEADETFTVNLGGARHASLADAAGEGLVTDDDAGPILELAVAPLRIEEHDAAAAATVTVSIANAARFPADRTVDLGFAGSAGAGDYAVADADGNALSAPWRLTLLAGATSTAATVTPVDDAVYEGDETLVVSATLDDGIAMATRRWW